MSKKSAGMEFVFGNAGITKRELEREWKRVAQAIERISRAPREYSSEESFIHLPADKQQVGRAISLAKKIGSVDMVVIVGIGGSNLGSWAVLDAVFGELHNETRSPQVYFADTVDPENMSDIVLLMTTAMKKGKKVLVNVISKSGTTLETCANVEVVLDVLKKFSKDYARQVVVTTDEGSQLYARAKQEKFAVLTIPKKIVGRFSVFSTVGLFPLALLGVDVGELVAGARRMTTRCMSAKVLGNPAAVDALIHFLQYKKGRTNAVLFLFSKSLEGLGRWYRQLLAESIGKEEGLGGRRVRCGITPLVSIGSVDLHSQLQLYLGGPDDKVTTFVAVKKYRRDVALGGKSFADILWALYKGTLAAYGKKNRPFCEIVLSEKKERSIGAFLQMKMLQVVYLAALFEVNAFDQPAVEVYKKEAARLLKKR